MSHFYSKVLGGRGSATRCGHKTTGITSEAQSHHVRVTVIGRHIHEGEMDPNGSVKSARDVFFVQVMPRGDSSGLLNNPGTSAVVPISITYDYDTKEVRISHVVSAGESHNVRVHQAEFELFPE